MVDEPPFVRLLRVDEVAGHAHLARAGDTDALREEHGETPTRHHAHSGVRIGETRAIGGDEEVARERELETTRDRDTVDRADQQLRARRQRAARREPALVVAAAHVGEALARSGCRARPELLEVDTRTERRIGSGEDHHVDGVVGLARIDRLRQLPAHRAIQRVAGVGPIQRDRCHPIHDVDGHHLFAHGRFLTLTPGRRSRRRRGR